MKDAITFIKELISDYSQELAEVSSELEPLLAKKSYLEAKLSKYKEVLEIEEDKNIDLDKSDDLSQIEPSQSVRTDVALVGIPPILAYQKIIARQFSDKPFIEADIRKIAHGSGVRTRDGGEITPSNSRSIFVKLKKNGIIKLVSRGTYRFERQKSLIRTKFNS